MNLEIGTVAVQFPEKEYLFRIFSIGSLQCTISRKEHKTIFSSLRITEMALSSQSDFTCCFNIQQVKFNNS